MPNQFRTTQDELDLNKLLTVLFKHKLLIFIITMTMTMGGILYSWTTTPIYRGSVLLEVGEVIINRDNPTIIKPLESIDDIIQILSQNYNTHGNEALEFVASSSSTVFIQISYEHHNKKAIQDKLEQMSQFTIKRHEEKANFFMKADSIIRPTIVASAITISETPIKPNKKLILVISFFSGLILSLFILFFIELFTKNRSSK